MKKYFLTIAFVASIVTFIGSNLYNSQKTTGLSDLVLTNIEALADPNESSECTNFNGYKEWNINHGFLEREKQFYDCCFTLRTAYSPSGICRSN